MAAVIVSNKMDEKGDCRGRLKASTLCESGKFNFGQEKVREC